MKKVICIGIFLLMLAIPASAKLTLQTRVSLISFPHISLNGIGLGLEGNYLELNIFTMQHIEGSLVVVETDKELYLETHIQNGILVELNYQIKGKILDYFLGINYFNLSDENSFGYQIGIRKYINDLAFLRCEFKSLGSSNILYFGIGIDLFRVASKIKDEFRK